MHFRLDPRHPVQDEIRRVSLELIEDARVSLTPGELELHAGIHQARKDFKKLRAVLRLVRAPLAELYSIESDCFRELGRQLASTRDSEAMIEAFDAMTAAGELGLRPDLAALLRAHLVAQREELSNERAGLERRREAIRGDLELARERVAGWMIPGEGFAAIEDGLRRGFRAARRAGREAISLGSPESFHEWRKRSKIHWYHTRLLADVWAEESPEWRSSLDQLNELLGHHQDLELLIELADSGIPNYTRFESDHLRQLLRRRQDRLRDEAAHRGAPYLAEKPRAFVTRVRDAWERASDPD